MTCWQIGTSLCTKLTPISSTSMKILRVQKVSLSLLKLMLGVIQSPASGEHLRCLPGLLLTVEIHFRFSCPMKLASTYQFLHSVALAWACERGSTLFWSGGHLLGRCLWVGWNLRIVESWFLRAGLEGAVHCMAHRFEYTDRLSRKTQSAALPREQESCVINTVHWSVS